MSVSIIRELFQQLPPPQKDQVFLDHCERYVDSSEGSRDLCDLIAHLSRTWELIAAPVGVTAQIKEVFEQAGLGLSFPQLFADVNRFKGRIEQLSWGISSRRIKEVAYSALLLVNTASRSVLFTQGSSLLALSARSLVRVNVVMSVTSWLTDGSDLVRDILEWQVEGKTPEKNCVAWLNVMKNLSSVAVSSLLLVSYTFGIAMSQPLMAGALFTLSTVYLSSKISGYFYDKMVAGHGALS